ncbi:TetR/AcrR family transcriptional regulator [Rhodococcus sp. NPDC058481]|uniref:TetR/AcrR family transcriptional regulator n=1 Tax=unclassified Rhodococcus (in: high G+C Gram-positive bacteria) TaxID=192944 RepID=UPI0036533F84
MDEYKALSRRERNKHETRVRLITAARTLFAERGVGGTTIDDIAETADVSRATFFNYFQSKDSVLAALHASHMTALSGVIDRILDQDLTTAERIRLVFDDVVQATYRFPGYLRAVTGELERDLASPEVSVERTERFNDEILRILEPGLHRGEVRTDYPLRFLAQMVAAVYVSVIRYWRQDPDYELEVGFGNAARFVAEALAPR